MAITYIKKSQLPSAKLALKNQLPEKSELAELAYYYHSYNWEHRVGILSGYFIHNFLDPILEPKFHANGIDHTKLTPQQLGGHTRWAVKKAERAIVRLIYMRYRKQGLSRKEANQQIYQKHVPFP